MSKPKEVKIRRISRPGYFGITAFKNSTTVIPVAITDRGFKTGLTSEEEAHYEKVLKLPEGTLDKHSPWWGEVFNTKYPIRLNNAKPTVLIIDNPINELRYKILLASNRIANSELEKKPYSDFFIENEELKAKHQNEIFDYELEGMERIYKMSIEEKRESLRLFGKTKLDTATESLLKAELFREVKKDPKKFIDILNDKNINLKAFVYELLEKGILKRNGQEIKFGEDSIGNSVESAVEYFLDTKNGDRLLRLKSRLDKTKEVKVTKE